MEAYLPNLNFTGNLELNVVIDIIYIYGNIVRISELRFILIQLFKSFNTKC